MEDIPEKRDKNGMNRTEHKLFVAMKGLGLNPEPQYKISEMTVDFAFPEHNLVIEVNGKYHDSEEQKHRDRKRWYVLNSLGWQRKTFKASSVNMYPIFVAEKIKEYIGGEEKPTTVRSVINKKTTTTHWKPPAREPYKSSWWSGLKKWQKWGIVIGTPILFLWMFNPKLLLEIFIGLVVVGMIVAGSASK